MHKKQVSVFNDVEKMERLKNTLLIQRRSPSRQNVYISGETHETQEAEKNLCSTSDVIHEGSLLFVIFLFCRYLGVVKLS